MWTITTYIAVVALSTLATFVVITRDVRADMARLEKPAVRQRDMSKAA